MPTFEYRALQTDGSIKLGKLDAAGRADAMQMIESLGFTPLRISETGSGQAGASSSQGTKAPGSGFAFKSRRVSFSALEDFTRSLSSLLTAGVPLSRALTILYKETSQPAAAAQWKELHDLVIDGVPLAEAMSRSPSTFPRVYVAMVEAGEAGGFLDVVLGQIADFQAREKELRAKISAALMYPAVLLVLAIGVVIFLMVFFIPRFQTLFQGFDAALPLITRVIVGISDAVRHYGLFIVGAMAIAIFLARKWLAQDEGRRAWERALLRMPIIGPLAAHVSMARFCRMLGTLLGAGVSLMSGLNVARRSLGYQTLIDMIADSTERVKKGESLAASLSNSRAIFPGSTLEMISVAEESGRLDQELVRLAAATEITLDRRLKTAVSLAEPIMLFVIAAFIGLIFIGMVLPIFTIQDSIK
jgi:type II secretory pathway component PulF